MHWREIIRRPLITEKSNIMASEQNQYTFVVDSRANKRLVKQAVELATWLTASEQAITIYKTLGNFPSAVRTWTSPEVADAKDAFFSDAPVGTIFPASLEKAPVQVYGPQWGIINTAFGNALTTVEKGTDPEKAWSKALKDVAAAAG